MSDETTQVSFTPAEKRGAILDLHPSQWIVLGSASAMTALILFIAPSGMSLLFSAIIISISLLLTFPQIFASRTAISWLPDIWAYWGKRFNGKLEFRSRTARKLALSSQAPVYVDTIAEGPLAGLRFFNYDGMGIVHHRALGTYTTVIEGRGRSFETLDEADQLTRINRWGGLLAGMSRESKIVSRFQWVESGLPADPRAPQRYLEENATVDIDDPARQSYEDLISAAGHGSRDHHTYIAIQIDRRASKSIRTNGGGDVGAGIVLARQVDALARDLTDAEIEVVRTLSSREIASVVHIAFDSEVIPILGLLEEATGEKGIEPTSATPIAAEEHWDAYHAGMWHVSGWIAEWPRRNVNVDFLANLIYFTTAARRLSVTFSPSSPVNAQRKIEKQRFSDDANQQLRERGGFRTSTRRRRQQDAAEKHDEALSDGEAMAEFVGHVTVSAKTYEEVESAWEEFEQSAAAVGIEVRRMKGRQVEGFMATLPFAQGIEPESGLKGWLG